MGIFDRFIKNNKTDKEFGVPKNDQEKWCLDICSVWCFAVNGKQNLLGGGFTSKSTKKILSRDWGLTIDENSSNVLIQEYVIPKINGKYEDLTVLAWEYCCAAQLLCLGYASEIITRETYNLHMFEIAKKLQSKFTSWQEMIENYFDGYLNATGNEDELEFRIKCFLSLNSENSDNFKTDWNTKF